MDFLTRSWHGRSHDQFGSGSSSNSSGTPAEGSRRVYFQALLSARLELQEKHLIGVVPGSFSIFLQDVHAFLG